MQTSFIVTKMADQSCFLDVQEYNEMIKNKATHFDEEIEVPAIQIPMNLDEENQETWENTDCTQQNEKEEQQIPYFQAVNNSPTNQRKIKPQPFLSSASRNRLEQLLKKDSFTQLSQIKESAGNLILKAFSVERNQQVNLSIGKGMKDDFLAIKEENERVGKIYNNQFLLNSYKIIYYEELFVFVIIQEAYEQTLQDEIDHFKKSNTSFSSTKANSLFFQMSFAITEIFCYNISHNNINPSNIFRTKEGKYKLGGFGSWKFVTKQSLQSLDNLVNLRYISPEQLEKLSNPTVEFTNKSDVYSLSAVMFDILSETQQTETQAQTPKLSQVKAKQNNNHLQADVVNHFKKYLLNTNPNKRLHSYEIIPSILKYIKPSYLSYQELMKQINQFLINPICNINLNITFIMKCKLVLSDLKLDIMKKNLDRLQPLLSIAKAIIENGQLCEEYGIFNKALERYQEAMKVYKQINAGNSEEIIELLRYTAQVYQKLGDYEKYNEFSLKSLEMAEQIYYCMNHQQVTTSLHFVSWSYYFLKDGRKALIYAERGLNMKKELQKQNSSRSLNGSFAHSLDTVGAAYQLLGNQEEALKYFLDGLSILKQSVKGTRPDIAASLNNIGVTYEEMKNYENSYHYFEQASNMYEKIYGKYHPLLLISKKGQQRSLKHLDREDELQEIERDIEEIENHIQKCNL